MLLIGPSLEVLLRRELLGRLWELKFNPEESPEKLEVKDDDEEGPWEG